MFVLILRIPVEARGRRRGSAGESLTSRLFGVALQKPNWVVIVDRIILHIRITIPALRIRRATARHVWIRTRESAQRVSVVPILSIIQPSRPIPIIRPELVLVLRGHLLLLAVR